ncbi:small ribosomal subunit protein uS3c-like [Lycium barbarum]|uniref:small ribosomal subunit protein uS3c-like n=1 Tax=Lycium barbarum TaxID=112863 RepID=UPI00293F1D31|nr:small ribosomal subunit protein uS3c-like [Lycium barbarum]
MTLQKEFNCVNRKLNIAVTRIAKPYGNKDTWTTPWELRNQIEEIKQDMRAMQVQINHIFREGNRLADFLANQALDHAGIKVHDFILMASEGRRILNMDKLQLPQLRIRTRRIQQIDHQQ